MKTIAFIILTLFFFASNSILCRLALESDSIDAFSFTLVRLISGALVLNIIVIASNNWKYSFTGKVSSAVSLLIYALLFSLAYLKLTAATGAIILFGFVQITMIGWSLRHGKGPTKNEWLGFVVAIAGLIYFLFPGIKAPDPMGALFMAFAGIAWGAYSIQGKGSKNPISNTAGNFSLACLISIPLLAVIFFKNMFTINGVVLAILSGAIASGIGYSIWYTVLPLIKSTQAAIVQLLVPAIAVFLATITLHESISQRLLISGIVISLGVIITLAKSKSERPNAKTRN